MIGLGEGAHAWLSLLGPKLEIGTEIGEAVSLTKCWPFGANHYRGYCLASWVIPRDSRLASFKSDLTAADFLGWLL